VLSAFFSGTAMICRRPDGEEGNPCTTPRTARRPPAPLLLPPRLHGPRYPSKREGHAIGGPAWAGWRPILCCLLGGPIEKKSVESLNQARETTPAASPARPLAPSKPTSLPGARWELGS